MVEIKNVLKYEGNHEKINYERKSINRICDIFQNTIDYPIFAGPCAIESFIQLDTVAKSLAELGIKFLRGGAFKPRTSPYSFQGIGREGLKMLGAIREKYNMYIVSEIMDIRDIEIGTQYIDLIQIGSRNMFNIPLLKEIGKTKHPVLLKRGMMATLEEFLMAVEYIVSEGNDKVVVCERGIRTFETSTRNTIDISSVAIIKKETDLPIIVDLSHSLGRTDIALPVAKAVYALGADGIMVEVHNDPKNALSDPLQQFSNNEFTYFYKELKQFIDKK